MSLKTTTKRFADRLHSDSIMKGYTQPVTLKTIVYGAYNPATSLGSETPTTTILNMNVRDFTTQEVLVNSQILGGDIRFELRHTTLVPTVHDTITWKSEDYEILDVDPDYIGADVLTYIIQARKIG